MIDRLSSVKQSDLKPVILGGDAGAYALALECYEAYGCKSIFVSNSPADIVTRSNIAELESIPVGISDDALLAVLKGIAAVHHDKKLILLANTDARAGFAARVKSELAPQYVVPFPNEESIAKLCNKDSFADACKAVGAKTPPQVVVDLSMGEAPSIPFDFPVVAKAASGDAYDRVSFDGKKKIYFIDEETELDALWKNLREAGYSDKFVVQETIPGHDSQMVSLTLYVDSFGEVTLRSGARVLLEDHSPAMVGNPVAMITEVFPDLLDKASQILKSADYRGFANFDIKIDPRSNEAFFFEVNPRIGRNSYYVAAAGVNPMEVMIRDLVGDERLTPMTAKEEVLYSLVPTSLILKYVDNESLKQKVEKLKNEGKVVSPLESDIETSKRRKAVVALQKLNYHRKFKQFFPKQVG